MSSSHPFLELSYDNPFFIFLLLSFLFPIFPNIRLIADCRLLSISDNRCSYNLLIFHPYLQNILLNVILHILSVFPIFGVFLTGSSFSGPEGAGQLLLYLLWHLPDGQDISPEDWKGSDLDLEIPAQFRD